MSPSEREVPLLGLEVRELVERHVAADASAIEALIKEARTDLA